MDSNALIIELQKLAQLATSRARSARLQNRYIEDRIEREKKETEATWNEQLITHINNITHYIIFYDRTNSDN